MKEWGIKSKMDGKVIEKEGRVYGCRFIVHRFYDVNRRVGELCCKRRSSI